MGEGEREGAGEVAMSRSMSSDMVENGKRTVDIHDCYTAVCDLLLVGVCSLLLAAVVEC